MGGLPDPDWYLDNVLIHAEPGVRTPIVVGPAARWQAWWRAQESDREPVATAARQGFLLTLEQLADLGISRSAMRTELRRGHWTAPARGIVCPLRVDNGADDKHVVARRHHALLAAAAAVRRPGHVVGCRSAAVLHGLPVMEIPDVAEVMAPIRHGLGRHSPGHAFGAKLPAYDVTTCFGVPVTTVARTLVDLARHDRRDGLSAADAALRERLVSITAIRAALADAIGWPGVRQARAVLALADPRAGSPLESIARLALHDSGFPSPQLQVDIAGYTVDFCWPEQRLIVEADGRGKYTDDELWREKKRETVLRRLGWRIERVLWHDVIRSWVETEARLWAALVDR